MCNVSAVCLTKVFLNPLTPNIKEQILLSFSLYVSYNRTGEKILRYQENSPWVIISLNSYDLKGCISIDITRRNLMVITVRALKRLMFYHLGARSQSGHIIMTYKKKVLTVNSRHT